MSNAQSIFWGAVVLAATYIVSSGVRAPAAPAATAPSVNNPVVQAAPVGGGCGARAGGGGGGCGCGGGGGTINNPPGI